jgi:ribosomal protein L37AE/L43A
LYHFLCCFPDNLALCDFFLVSELTMELRVSNASKLQDGSKLENEDGRKSRHELARVRAVLLSHAQCHRCRRYLVRGGAEKANLCDMCSKVLASSY